MREFLRCSEMPRACVPVAEPSATSNLFDRVCPAFQQQPRGVEAHLLDDFCRTVARFLPEAEAVLNQSRILRVRKFS